MRFRSLLFGSLCASFMFASTAPVRADDDSRHGGDDRHRQEWQEHHQPDRGAWEHERRERAEREQVAREAAWRQRQWREHEMREHELRERQGYRAPAVVVAPAYGAYSPPAVVYTTPRY